MNPFAFARRRPITTLSLALLSLISGGIMAAELAATEADDGIVPALDTASIGSLSVNSFSLGSLLDRVRSMTMSAEPEEQSHEEHSKIVVTRPKVMDVTISKPFVCQIHARRHIEVRALVSGYLEEVRVKEGQSVKKGEVLFKLLPVIYQAKLNADKAEAKLAELNLQYTKELAERGVVSKNEVKLREAELAQAQANVERAKADVNFTDIVAPFDGIVDELHRFQGSLIEEGDVLTALTDNSVMWVYFNVPEADYFEYMSGRQQDERIELVLANGEKYPHVGKIAAIEAQFNNKTGTVPFRADFPNPDRLLRHGQTGTVLISRTLEDAIVIPQLATFDVLDQSYVYVVDENHVVHRRLISIFPYEKEDIFVIESGLDESDKIVLEGVRHVRDGEKTEYEFREPDEVLANLKYHAE